MSPTAVFETAGRPLLEAAVAFDPDAAHVVGVGGAIGAILRYWVFLALPDRRFPWATLAVNVLGSFVLAATTVAGSSETTVQLLGVGICGSFTTFSTFSVDTVGLYERGDRRRAAAFAGGNLLLSLAAIGLAWVVVG